MGGTAKGSGGAEHRWKGCGGRLFQLTGPSSNNRFLYDGDELVAEYDYAGTLANRYVHSDNADDPVVLYGSAAVGAAYRIFLMPDERGSIAGHFANDGTSTAKNVYDEYGIPGQYNQGRFGGAAAARANLGELARSLGLQPCQPDRQPDPQQ